MKKIYERATTVMVWLGTDDEEHGKEAVEFILAEGVAVCLERGYQPLDLKSEDELCKVLFATADSHLDAPFLCDMEPPLTALRWFYSRQWFVRLWVVQEVNVGREVMVLCGSNSIDWQFVAYVAESIYRNDQLYHKCGFDRTNCWNAAAMRWPEFRTNPDILGTLRFARNFQTSDTRDRVYALLGLHDFAQQCIPVVADYTKPANQLFLELAQVRILKTQCLDTLSHVQQQDIIQRPSWVPHWNLPNQVYVIVRGGTKSWFQEFAPKFFARFDETPGMISLRGIQMDTVKESWRVGFDTFFRLPSKNDSTVQVLNQELLRALFHLETFAGVYSAGLEPSNGFGNVPGLESYLSADSEDNLTNIIPHAKWQSLHNYLFSSKSISQNRSLFRMNSGRFGLGPSVTKPDDLVCILFGGKVPYILRPEEEHYLLIGESYVHGYMDGLIIKDSLYREQIFEIR
jgi:Heterokaryon incompatibility protein (HET)